MGWWHPAIADCPRNVSSSYLPHLSSWPTYEEPCCCTCLETSSGIDYTILLPAESKQGQVLISVCAVTDSWDSLPHLIPSPLHPRWGERCKHIPSASVRYPEIRWIHSLPQHVCPSLTFSSYTERLRFLKIVYWVHPCIRERREIKLGFYRP